MPSNDANGGDGSDGVGNGVSDGGGFGGWGGGSSSGLGSGLYGMEDYGYAPTIANPSPSPSYGYYGPNVNGMNLGNLPGNAAAVNDFRTSMGPLSNVPGISALTNLAGIAAWGMDRFGPREQAEFRSASGTGTPAGGAPSTESSASGDGNYGGGSGGINGDYREGGVDSSWVRGPASGTGEGEAPAATDPLADIFAEFTGSAGDITYNAPAYNADPSGLLTKGGNYADTYERQFAPYARKLMDQVDLYGNDKYREQQRSQAMAGIQQQSDAGYGSAQRNMMRQGVNPASGRMAAMANQNAIQIAAAKTQAAMNSDASLRDTYNKGLTAVNQLGVDVSKLGQGWAALGNDAAKTQNTWGLANSELGLKAATQNQNNRYNWGSLGVQKYGIDKGIDAKADAALSDNQWTLGTALVGGLLGGGSSTETPWWAK